MLAALPALAAQPAAPPSPTAQCIAAVAAAEQRYSLPPGLLGTMAKAESGRPDGAGSLRAWPWTVDADGAGIFFDTQAQAVAWTRAALAGGIVRYLDVGCLQVDLQMHPAAFPSLEAAFDPAHNADYAARYLRALREQDAGGNWYIAVGLYHSHTEVLAASYRDRVAAVGAGIVTGAGAPEPLYQRTLRRGTLHLALAGGRMLTLSTSRQHTVSACRAAALLAPLLAARARPQDCAAPVPSAPVASASR